MSLLDKYQCWFINSINYILYIYSYEYHKPPWTWMKIGTNLALFKTHQVPHVLDPASAGSRWNSAAFRSDLQEVSYASFAGTVSLEWWSPELSDLEERLGLKNTNTWRKKWGENWENHGFFVWFYMVLYGFVWFYMVLYGFLWFLMV